MTETTLYEKSENLWQTLNAVRILSSTGLPLDEETRKLIKDCIDNNNPCVHEKK